MSFMITVSFFTYIVSHSFFFFFFFNDTATTEIYTLSLHDALPISFSAADRANHEDRRLSVVARLNRGVTLRQAQAVMEDRKSTRLNSSHSQISYAVFCLKKKKKKKTSEQMHLASIITS